MAEDERVANARLSTYTKAQLQSILEARSNPSEAVAPNMEGYTPEIEKLNGIIDKLEVFMAMIESALTKKKANISPALRPKTAFDRALDKALYELEREEMEDLGKEFGF